MHNQGYASYHMPNPNIAPIMHPMQFRGPTLVRINPSEVQHASMMNKVNPAWRNLDSNEWNDQYTSMHGIQQPHSHNNGMSHFGNIHDQQDREYPAVQHWMNNAHPSDKQFSPQCEIPTHFPFDNINPQLKFAQNMDQHAPLSKEEVRENVINSLNPIRRPIQEQGVDEKQNNGAHENKQEPGIEPHNIEEIKATDFKINR